MEQKDLSELEIKWLSSRGGRLARDVYQDEKWKYVVMINEKGEEVKEYIPKKRKLIKMFMIKKDGTKRETI